MVIKQFPKQFKRILRVGVKSFGAPPPQYKASEERRFTSWKKIETGEHKGEYYQGEVDDDGNPNGRGILMYKNVAMVVGYHMPNGITKGVQWAFDQLGEHILIIGTWSTKCMIDVDIYKEKVYRRKTDAPCIYSQVRNCVALDPNSYPSISLDANPKLMPMKQGQQEE